MNTFLESKNSSSKAIYDKTDRLVEKCSEIIHFAIAKLTSICWIFPKVIISCLKYFTTDLGNAAFELQLYYW